MLGSRVYVSVFNFQLSIVGVVGVVGVVFRSKVY